MNPHILAQSAQYCNIPELQTQFLKANASVGAKNLYDALYRLGRKTDGIITKSLAYMAKVVNYTPRHISRLTRELEELGCLETLPRSNYKGKLCNQYVLSVPESIVQAIQAKPRKPGLATKLKELKQIAVYQSIDFSVDLSETAYMAESSDISQLTPPDKNVTSHIFSPLQGRENYNKGGPTRRDGPPIIDNELTESDISDLKTFTQMHSAVPDDLFTEMVFAIRKRFFAGQGLLHAVNQAKKIVKDGNWSTPYGMFKAYRESLPKKEKPKPKVYEPVQPPIVYIKSPMLPGETQAQAMTRLNDLMKSVDAEVKHQAMLDLRTVMRMPR